MWDSVDYPVKFVGRSWGIQGIGFTRGALLSPRF